MSVSITSDLASTLSESAQAPNGSDSGAAARIAFDYDPVTGSSSIRGQRCRVLAP